MRCVFECMWLLVCVWGLGVYRVCGVHCVWACVCVVCMCVWVSLYVCWCVYIWVCAWVCLSLHVISTCVFECVCLRVFECVGCWYSSICHISERFFSHITCTNAQQNRCLLAWCSDWLHLLKLTNLPSLSLSDFTVGLCSNITYTKIKLTSERKSRKLYSLFSHLNTLHSFFFYHLHPDLFLVSMRKTPLNRKKYIFSWHEEIDISKRISIKSFNTFCQLPI